MFYADPSFLVAAYTNEPDSDRVLEWMQRHSEPLPFTPFHRHEVRTAIRQKVFRGEITHDLAIQALAEMERDLDELILAHTAIPWTNAFREAERIGNQIAEGEAIRSAELLHVGIAVALDCKHFLTLDQRQARAIQVSKLQLVFR